MIDGIPLARFQGVNNLADRSLIDKAPLPDLDFLNILRLKRPEIVMDAKVGVGDAQHQDNTEQYQHYPDEFFSDLSNPGLRTFRPLMALPPCFTNTNGNTERDQTGSKSWQQHREYEA